ncbi:MAG: hypothetical protein MJ252_25155 [archaeon]|nr:hypothetical protein [archaeon]
MGNCCKCFKRCLKKCDAFGTFICFRMGDDLEYNSLIGGISTLLFGAFTIFYIIINAIPFVTRQNVELIYTNKVLMSDPVLDLVDSKFNIAFGVQYSADAWGCNEDFADYLEYNISMRYWIGDDDPIDHPLPTKDCEMEDFYHETDDTFDINGIADYVCPDLSAMEEPYILEGLYTDDIFIFMLLTVRIKDEVMEDPEKLEELEQMMADDPIEMAIFFPDCAIDYESRKEPTPTYINYIYKSIEFKFFKKTETFISLLEFKNDENLIVNSEHVMMDTMLDRFSDTFAYKEERDIDVDEDHNIGQFILKASQKQIQVSRSYQKFPSFVADLTGILEEILVLLLLLINFLERKTVDLKLIKKMLKYKGSKYYDVNYLINAFEEQNIRRKVMAQPNRRDPKILGDGKDNPDTKDKSERSKEVSESQPFGNEMMFDLRTISIKRKKKLINNFDSMLESAEHQSNEGKKKNSANNSEIEMKDLDNDLNRASFEKEIENDIKSGSIVSEVKVKTPSHKSKVEYEEDEEESGSYNKEMLSDDGDPKKPNVFKFTLCKWLTYMACSCCSSRMKKRLDVVNAAADRIHHYLDIYTYIKKMQEIDILKYTLFDDDQMYMFNFLANPPVSGFSDSNSTYSEFQKLQKGYKVITKNEVDALIQSYMNVKSQKEVSFEDYKLLKLVHAEVEFLNGGKLEYKKYKP